MEIKEVRKKKKNVGNGIANTCCGTGVGVHYILENMGCNKENTRERGGEGVGSGGERER